MIEIIDVEEEKVRWRVTKIKSEFDVFRAKSQLII